jgi:hypothetical protein
MRFSCASRIEKTYAAENPAIVALTLRESGPIEIFQRVLLYADVWALKHALPPTASDRWATLKHTLSQKAQEKFILILFL